MPTFSERMIVWKKIFAVLPGWASGFFSLVVFCGCLQHTMGPITVLPAHFNSRLSFQIDNRGILIPVYWGTDKKEYKLYVDNHSPTWANDVIIRKSGAVSKSNDFLYSTTTADGQVIAGDVYICDSIRIGNISFKSVPLYNISNKTNESRADGSIGDNIMAEGIWKIDFKNHLLTVASAIDSITLGGAELLPCSFTDKAIEIEIGFHNNIKERVALDLGYNGYIILPAKVFASVTAQDKKTYKTAKRFSTPGGSATIEEITISDSIRAGGQMFGTLISTNERIKEKLIGLNFFNRFNFIIIDYINKAVYLPAKSAD